MKKVIVFLLALFFIGCSSKTITFEKEKDCKLNKNTDFIIRIDVVKEGNFNNFYENELRKISYNLVKSLEKNFPSKNIYVLDVNNNNKVIYNNDKYSLWRYGKRDYIVISLIAGYTKVRYKTYEEINTYHWGNNFNINSFGTNGLNSYYGRIGGSWSTTYVPTTKTRYDYIGLLGAYHNSDFLFYVKVYSLDYNDIFDTDWIDRFVKELKKCQ